RCWAGHADPFFFQAEDGIRVPLVTGVQTCALPIFLAGQQIRPVRDRLLGLSLRLVRERVELIAGDRRLRSLDRLLRRVELVEKRSEERRVGKEWGSRSAPQQYQAEEPLSERRESRV